MQESATSRLEFHFLGLAAGLPSPFLSPHSLFLCAIYTGPCHREFHPQAPRRRTWSTCVKRDIYTPSMELMAGGVRRIYNCTALTCGSCAADPPRRAASPTCQSARAGSSPVFCLIRQTISGARTRHTQGHRATPDAGHDILQALVLANLTGCLEFMISCAHALDPLTSRRKFTHVEHRRALILLRGRLALDVRNEAKPAHGGIASDTSMLSDSTAVH